MSRGGADSQRAPGQRAAGSARPAAGDARTDFRCAGRGFGDARRSGRRSANLLAAVLLFFVSLGPFAMAAAMRVSVESWKVRENAHYLYVALVP